MDKKFPIRLSHSSLQLLHNCERKFELEKLLMGAEREESEHFSYGHAYGAGVASYLIHQDQDLALYEAWLAYWPQLETDKKNQASCFSALMNSFSKLDTLLQDFTVVHFEGKPAAELSFRLEISENYYFVGYVDVVLQNVYTGEYVILEVKHTGLQLLDLGPLYKNSGQALGYSIALDRIVGKKLSSYSVIYFVAQLGKDYKSTIHVLEYPKTILDRLNWFLTLGLDVKHLEEMAELRVYPQRGDSCLKFNKPCPHFGTCGLHSLDVPKEQEEDLIEYQFNYKLEELIADHVNRVSETGNNVITMEEI